MFWAICPHREIIDRYQAREIEMAARRINMANFDMSENFRW